MDTLIPAWDVETSPYLCGKRLAAVYPDGTVGPCIRDHSFKTGTIFDADPLSIIQCDAFHYDISKPEIPDECRECESRTACHGGCPHDKLLLTGTTSGKSVECDVHKKIIPMIKTFGSIKKRYK
ncbi:SPASM domain-containing protein [Pelotomaculum terephthalicicum JT]|uniref:SPASM domain-containing protein n=1 Tax=Pelotomaculum terephthalicicum TaxID=206393 RepID=UPI001F04B2EE|nr:SPASM domain-containing protein [Pelotomaculum terephthalicicum]MCG9968604.1 SPASM domain-containing protein [Pelotomaculum terephthalicicum JT]